MLAYFLAFLGGIALFMYGMQLMGDGLQKAAGAKLQKILEAMTGVLAMGILLGAVVTAVLQASGATTVMTVGLVNAGLLTLKQGFGIIMGANIGTTMTAQLIAFKLSDYITILIFIGFLMQLLARKSRTKYLGQVMLGFGILMLGMDMMGKAVMPLRNYSGFVHFIEVFSSNPLLGIGIGMIMTVLIQSSSATIGILIAMAGQGLIPLEGAIPVLLGDNIGTCITAVLASLRANLTAKRVAAAHVMFNVIGSIIFVILMPFFIKFVLLVSPDGDIARQIANAHSAFNILNTLLFMPFVNPFIKLVEKIVPGKAEIISMRPVYLDKNMLNTPSIAISLAVKEVVRMGELARKDVRLGMEAIQSFDADKVKYVLEHEPVVDALERDITDYLTQMSSSEMSESLTTRHTGLLHACTDIERIGDHGETLAKRARKLVEDDVVFSDEAKAELLFEDFNGECSKGEVDRLVALARDNGCDIIVGVGGGKILDTAKAVAYYLESPVIICPTIASTDAPCSALSVLYTDDGQFDKYLFLKANPNIVLMDTTVIAASPVRLTVSGMGDALATYFEAQATHDADGGTCAGGKGGMAGLALAKLCYETLMADGVKAKVALEKGALTPAVEHIIEANTLLSGIGFESSGLAAAHAIHNGLTMLPECHGMYHGEKVAFGTIVQLVLEDAPTEKLEEVLGFCIELGLPVTMKELGVAELTREQVMIVAEAACAPEDTMCNMPFEVTPEMVANAILGADALGHYYLMDE